MRALIALTVSIVAAGAALAQSIDGVSIVHERARLITARHAARAAEGQAARLEAKAAAARDAAARTRARIAALNAQIRGARADVSEAEARLRIIEALRRDQRARLAAQQAGIVRLAGALETMARRPPALALMHPGSLDDLVHVRALLATTLPAVRARTAGLRAEIAHANRLAAQADRAAAGLRASRYGLDRARLELVVLEGTQRARAGDLENSAADQAEQALGLGERARDLADEMQELGAATDVASALAALPPPTPRPLSRAASARPDGDEARYALPLDGAVATGFGEVNESGVDARGITFAAKDEAKVRAPAAGRILFAGPFRSYGNVVIIDHGGGWTTTLTGLAKLKVAAGDRVAKGAMLGRAADERARITAELRRGGRPVDIGAMFAAG